MKTCLVTLSPQGARVLERIKKAWPEADCFVHENVPPPPWAQSFGKIAPLTERLFAEYESLVYVAPAGAVVRAIAPLVRDKKSDPAVVVADAGGRNVVSLLSGHEGGANQLAIRIANIIGAEPVITTTTEAVKSYIVGLGMRRGRPAEDIKKAVLESLKEARVDIGSVRYLASVDIKADEKGLLETAEELGVPLRFIDSDEIRQTFREFDSSEFVWKEVNLPAVAEPCALLAGRRTVLILRRKIFSGVTVAIARENCSSLE